MKKNIGGIMKLSSRQKFVIQEILAFIALIPFMFIALGILIMVLNLVYSGLFGKGFLPF